jgi:hypothetical protein
MEVIKVLLIDIDSRIPNLALKKIEKYHIQCGDEVIWNMPLWSNIADKVYASCVFTENRDEAASWEGVADIGGSGYDIGKNLPPEIEAMKPHINLGFTSRGCIRHCPFCIVPEKEGEFHTVGDLYDLWDGKSSDVTIMDNNILADTEHFAYVCNQSLYPKIRLDFNQGLDHRLLTPEIVRLMKRVRHKEYRFSFDHVCYMPGVEKAIAMLKAGGIIRVMWYVLVGFDSTFEQDLARLNFLREHNQTAFVQRYKKNRGNLMLGRWANRHNLFKARTFDQFLSLDSNIKYRQKYALEVDAYLG